MFYEYFNINKCLVYVNSLFLKCKKSSNIFGVTWGNAWQFLRWNNNNGEEIRAGVTTNVIKMKLRELFPFSEVKSFKTFSEPENILK